mgnify:CR=1 FL=1
MEKLFWQKVCLEFKGYVESFLASKEKIENENKNLNKAINVIEKKINETQKQCQRQNKDKTSIKDIMRSRHAHKRAMQGDICLWM